MARCTSTCSCHHQRNCRGRRLCCPQPAILCEQGSPSSYRLLSESAQHQISMWIAARRRDSSKSEIVYEIIKCWFETLCMEGGKVYTIVRTERQVKYSVCKFPCPGISLSKNCQLRPYSVPRPSLIYYKVSIVQLPRRYFGLAGDFAEIQDLDSGKTAMALKIQSSHPVHEDQRFRDKRIRVPASSSASHLIGVIDEYVLTQSMYRNRNWIQIHIG